MSMRPFTYESTRSLEAVVTALGEGARPLAGGTDLLTLMKADIAQPDRLINIKRVVDLTDGIDTTAGELRMGALVTLAQIERHDYIRERFTAIAEAAELAATPQLRNMATIGGNLLQRPRCPYFRDAQIPCWLKGGSDCPARKGENGLHALFPADPCVAVHPSDLASALLAFDAELTVRGGTGERRVPLTDFFALPEDNRRTENTLGPDEIIVSLHVPEPAEGTWSTYLKAMDRKVWAFALVGVAAVGGDHPRLVLSGVSPIPYRARAAEERMAAGGGPGEVADMALAGARPLEHNGYKVPLAKTLVRRAVEAVRGALISDDHE